MIIKRRKIKGMYIKGSPIAIDPSFASDTRNVVVDTKNELRKRAGYTTQLTDAGIIDTVKYEGTQGSEILYVKNDGLYKNNAGTLEKIKDSYQDNGDATDYNGLVDYAEFNNVLYITDTEQRNFVNKYDGQKMFRAGIEKPEIISVTRTSTGGINPKQRWIRVFLSHLDFQLNEVFSDIYQQDLGVMNEDDTYQITIQNQQYLDYKNNCSSFISDGDVAVGTQTNSWVFGYKAKNNLEIGDYVYITYVGSADPYIGVYYSIPMKVINIYPGTSDIELEGQQIVAGISPQVTNDKSYSNIRVYAFISEVNEDFGYTETQIQPSFPNYMDFTVANSVITLFNVYLNAQVNRPLTEIYDDSLLKGIPPRCKYITFHDGQMILAASKEVDTTDQSSTITQNTIYWSDPTIGGSVESFSPSADAIIGKTDEGQITGIKSFSDYMVIFKKFATYLMYGDLFNLNVRFQKASAFNVGCVSHKSIIEVINQCLFMTEKGIYTVSPNGDVMEYSEALDPIFELDYPIDLEIEKTRAILDFKQELIAFHIPGVNKSESITLTANYKTGDWFIFDAIDASKGFYGDQTKVVTVSDGGVVKHDNTSLDDDGAAINAYYATGWEDLGEASLWKKFLNVFMFTINSLAYAITVKLQTEWTETDVSTRTESKGSSDRTIKSDFQANQTRSARIIFENNVAGEDLQLSGYDVTVEHNQSRVKR